MTLRLISILSLTLLFILPAQLDAFITQNTGCHHNGTWFADKSLIPTMEKCLNCQCNKKTLICRLKVCPEMPMPPPRGCVVVQKKSTCCPYLSCARLDAFYKIPTKRRIIAYLDHYERESIDRVVNENMLQRRSDDAEVDLFVCVKNGTVYKSGSAMSSSNLCSYCYCIGGSEKCVKPKCMLPVEGCKPIFVDSTCCPVRYDCSQKPSGKSSQEVRYRKTSNKHFLRMSQRPLRNRGCTVGKQFYTEGQKMKSDTDKPCDICFCIRGTRRCAPKKCSPALKNCIPVVPKGQCCPSSYDCGAQRDYRRAQNSRQFNLFSLFFGKEDAITANATSSDGVLAERYPHDRHPTEASVDDAMHASSEKSIFDTLREGLEFIDSNNNQMLADNLDLLALQTTEPSPAAVTMAMMSKSTADTQSSSTTDMSFLDLLLGPTEHVDEPINSVEKREPEEKTTTSNLSLSWVDLLLGPDDDEATNVSTKAVEVASTTELTTPIVSTNIERIADDFDDYLGGDEIAVGELPAEAQQILLTNNAYGTNHKNQNHESLKKNPSGAVGNPTIQQADSNDEKPTVGEHIFNAFLDGISDILSSSENTTTTLTNIKQTPTPSDANAKPGTTTSTTTNSTTKATTTTSKPIIEAAQNRTPPQPPMFKPLPLHKPQHTRINSKIANLTITPPMVSTKSGQNVTFKPLAGAHIKRPLAGSYAAKPSTPIKTTTATAKPSTALPKLTSTNRHTTTSTAHKPTTTTKPVTTSTPRSIKTTTDSTVKPVKNSYITSTTLKPVIIKTNPTILEAEPLDETNVEPTLPPSLPNLKIIPFLPTDAVNTELKQQQQTQNQQQTQPQQYYDYYNNNAATTKIDFGTYDEVSLYPALTSAYPQQFSEYDPDRAEYKYKFKIEGPSESVPELPPGNFEGTADYVKYDFNLDGMQPSKGFSPPTKTEGGFVPKAPLPLDDDSILLANNEPNNYHMTQHIIDITTGASDVKNTTELIIELTTPDPFKNVIRTEPPPDLTSFIGDKESDIPAHNQRKHNRTMTTRAPHVANVLQTLNAATQIDKTEIDQINKLDTLLDALLGAVAKPSTVPPFKTLPTTTTAITQNDNQPKPTNRDSSRKPSEDNLVPSTRPTLEATRAKNGTATPATPTTSMTTSTTIPVAAVATKVTRIKPKPKQPPRTVITTTTTTTTTNVKRITNAPATATATATTKPNRLKTQTLRRNATTTNTTVRPVWTTTNKTNTNKSTITVTTTTPSTIPMRPKPSSNIRTKPTTTAAISALTINKKVMPTPITTRTTTTTAKPTTTIVPISVKTSTTVRPFIMSPFDKLPFMDTSYEVKPNMLHSQQRYHHQQQQQQQQQNEVQQKEKQEHQQQQQQIAQLDMLQYKQQLHQSEGFEPSVDYASTTQTVTSVPAGPIASTNLIDASGMLKLAGCNIYGRMYRVGRIIVELSSPCLECKCTEVGVKCGPLDC